MKDGAIPVVPSAKEKRKDIASSGHPKARAQETQSVYSSTMTNTKEREKYKKRRRTPNRRHSALLTFVALFCSLPLQTRLPMARGLRRPLQSMHQIASGPACGSCTFLCTSRPSSTSMCKTHSIVENGTRRLASDTAYKSAGPWRTHGNNLHEKLEVRGANGSQPSSLKLRAQNADPRS